ncbi:MAG TPA: bifunctional nuclease family protein [Candidatus Nanopelagicaceae bacterium]
MGIPVEVVGVRIEMPSNQPIVLLKEVDGVRYLPLWIGAVEASAIAFAQQGLVPVRPLTHDLFTSVLHILHSKVERIEITDLVDGVFYADLHLEGGVTISARPSDAIALALRAAAPIEASEALFAKAGIEIPDQSEDEVEKFREFLDQINPDDFAS